MNHLNNLTKPPVDPSPNAISGVDALVMMAIVIALIVALKIYKRFKRRKLEKNIVKQN